MAIHGSLLAQFGGRSGLLDEGLLATSMEAPKNHLAYGRPSIVRLAAVYAYSLVQNHPFVDGNKRVALTVAAVLLERNGVRFDAPEPQVVAVMNALASGEMSRDEFERWLETVCSTAD